MEDKITRLLELFSIEEALMLMEIEPQEVIEILVQGGHVELPPFLNEEFEDGLFSAEE